MPVAAVLASQRASTSVGGGVTSSARADGVPEITITMARAASVPSTGPRSISVVVVPPAVAMLVGSATMAGSSVCEVDD